MNNTAPTFNGTLGQTAFYVQAGDGPVHVLHGTSPAVILDPDVTVLDAELHAWNDYNGAAIRIYREGGANADDHFYLANYYRSGGYPPSMTQANGVLDIVFGAGTTQASVDYLLRSISYINASGDPPPAVDLVWEFRDGNGGGQGEGGQLVGTGITPVVITPAGFAPWVDALLPWRPDYEVSVGDLQELIAQGAGMARTFYYSFPDTPPAYKGAAYAEGFVPLTTAQRESVRAALDYIGTIVNLHFEETSNPDQAKTLLFDNRHVAGAAGSVSATMPSGDATGSDISFITDSPPNLSDATWSPILLQGIARALGLPHMSTQSATFSDLEIAALQAVYGPAEVNNADPVWPYDTHTLSATEANFVWNGYPGHALSAAGQTEPVTLHLDPGHWDFIGSRGESITSPGQVTINYGTDIWSLQGGSGNDLLVGSARGNGVYGGGGDDTVQGAGGDDILSGGDGDNVVEGGDGNDALFVYLGDDRLDGGAGIDTGFFGDVRSAYSVTRTETGFTVASRETPENTATFVATERLVFTGSAWAMDLDGNAGAVARIIGAVFGKQVLQNAMYVHVGLNLADSGLTYDEMSAYALEVALRSNPDATDAEVVQMLYSDVMGVLPDAGTLDYYVGLLENGTFTRTTLVSYAARTSYNDANIDLVGLSEAGLLYSGIDA